MFSTEANNGGDNLHHQFGFLHFVCNYSAATALETSTNNRQCTVLLICCLLLHSLMCDSLNIELFLNFKILNEYKKISMILSGRVFVSCSWRNIDENHYDYLGFLCMTRKYLFLNFI